MRDSIEYILEIVFFYKVNGVPEKITPSQVAPGKKVQFFVGHRVE